VAATAARLEAAATVDLRAAADMEVLRAAAATAARPVEVAMVNLRVEADTVSPPAISNNNKDSRRLPPVIPRAINLRPAASSPGKTRARASSVSGGAR
jgi:hypothetical protein